MAEAHLSPRQEKWFASVVASLERDTGRSLDEWVAIARTCPETRHRARLAWFKERHGLMQNRASQVISAAFGGDMAWNEPDKLVDALWADADKRAIFEAVRAAATALPDVVMGPRKSYTAFSRKIQFAAVRPDRKGGAVLGLAVPLDASVRLSPRKSSESWAEKLVSLPLTGPGDVDDEVKGLIKLAWERC
jgi:predicted transport protein